MHLLLVTTIGAAGNATPGHALLELAARSVLWLALLGVAAFLIKRRWCAGARAKTHSAHFEILETKSLGPKRALHLVRVGSTHLLVGASEAGLHSLGTAELPVPAALSAESEPAGLSAPADSGAGAARPGFLERLSRPITRGVSHAR